MMLTSRIQRAHTQRPSPWEGGTTPAELEAAADQLLAEADGVSVATIRNRDWRDTLGQGPSYEALVWHAQNREKEEDVDESLFDELVMVVASAFRSGGPAARGGPARALDRDTWNAIYSLYPWDGPDRDVLILSAQYGPGESEKIGAILGISGRRVRQIQDQLLAWAKTNLAPAQIDAHLDDPITTERVKRRPPSLAGRKPKATATRVPRFLTLAPVVAGPERAPRPYRPRRPCPRFLDPNQTNFWEAA